MKILFVENADKYSEIENVIKKSFSDRGDSVTCTKRVDVFDEAYMLEIVRLVNESGAEILFSVGFLEGYSLLCGVLKKTYGCWILDYDEGRSYSYAVRNAWNRIFTSSPTLYERLKTAGANISYLPLFPTVKTSGSRSLGEPDGALFWTDGIEERVPMNIVINELKDATKGYIDAVMEARRSDLRVESFTRMLPDYVFEDLTANAEFEKTSLLTTQEHFDYECFYPMLDRTMAFPYLYALMGYKVVNHVFLSMSREMPYKSKDLTRIDRDEIVEGGYDELEKYKVVVYYSKFTDDGMISIDLWNIMAKGIFVMVSSNTDLSLLGDEAPESFKNTLELEMKVRYFLAHEDERKERARRMAEMVSKLGGCDERVSAIAEGCKDAVFR